MFNSDQKRMFLAVVLSGIILFGWQYFFAPKPGVNTPPATTSQTVDSKAPVSDSKLSETQAAQTSAVDPTKEPINLQSLELKNGDFSFVLNSDLSFESGL